MNDSVRQSRSNQIVGARCGVGPNASASGVRWQSLTRFGRVPIRTFACAVLVVFVSRADLQAQDNDLAKVVVRQSVSPEETALVGQRVELTIDVLAQDVWANLPRLPDIDLSGAIVFSPPGSSIRLTESMDGGTFIGQRYQWWIFPQRSGELRIPEIKLNVQLKPLGFGLESTQQEAATKPLDLAVSFPEGAEASTGLICTPDFKASQSWMPDQSEVVVGDGITRTITRRANDLPAMAMAPLPTVAIEGIGVYPKQPNVDDQFDRGELASTRIDSLTYVFEQPGEFALPPIRLSWWDVNAKQMKEEVLDGRKVTVRAAENAGTLGADSSKPEDAQSPHSFTWAIVAFALVGGLGWYYREPIAAATNAWIERRRNSEAASFRRFNQAAREGDPSETLRTLIHWWDVANPNDPAPRLDVFLQQHGDASASRQLSELEQAVDQDLDHWQNEAFVRSIRGARRRWKTAVQQNQALRESPLPPLNPLR